MKLWHEASWGQICPKAFCYSFFALQRIFKRGNPFAVREMAEYGLKRR